MTGTYYDTLISSYGCDSIVTLDLTVLPLFSTNLEATICAGETYSFGGNTLTESGIYSETYVSVSGCDSIVTLQLTILPSLQTELYDTICENESYTFDNQTLFSSGTYTKTLLSFSGCDSLVTLHLTLLPELSNAINSSICEGESYIFGASTLSESGTYLEVFQTASGCDSIVTLDLTVLPAVDTNLSATVCKGETYSFGGIELTESGTYSNVLQSNEGCDSTITLHLSVLPTYSIEIFDTICIGELYAFGENTLMESGTYSYVYSSTSQCDSSVTLYLTVLPEPTIDFSIPSSISPGDEITLNADSDASNPTYYWESNCVLRGNGLPQVTLVPTEETWVKLTITDTYGCSTTLTHAIGTDDYSTLYVPNTVTPDGGNFNNYFQAVGTNIQEFYMAIYNRWGELIFESYDINGSWDCTYGGKIVPDGVYIYKIDAKGSNQVKHNKIGHVIVLR